MWTAFLFSKEFSKRESWVVSRQSFGVRSKFESHLSHVRWVLILLSLSCLYSYCTFPIQLLTTSLQTSLWKMPSGVPGVHGMSLVGFFKKQTHKHLKGYWNEGVIAIVFKAVVWIWGLRSGLWGHEKKRCQRKQFSLLILLFRDGALPQKSQTEWQPSWAGTMGQKSCCDNLATFSFR